MKEEGVSQTQNIYHQVSDFFCCSCLFGEPEGALSPYAVPGFEPGLATCKTITLDTCTISLDINSQVAFPLRIV